MKSRIALMAAGLWWGSLTAIGFIAVPLLFVHLPSPALAGNMAARLFTAQGWVSVVCTLLLLALSRRGDGGGDGGEPAALPPATLAAIAGGLLLALLIEYGVAPRIVARENLRLWHSLGTGMYFVQWLCAGWTLWRLGAQGSGRAGLS